MAVDYLRIVSFELLEGYGLGYRLSNGIFGHILSDRSVMFEHKNQIFNLPKVNKNLTQHDLEIYQDKTEFSDI